MRVLSLFDGISAAQIALRNLRIPYHYTAIEIDKYARKVTDYWYPETLRPVHDVIAFEPKEPYDLVIGGSPCQDLSSMKMRSKFQGLKGKKSSLFFEYLRILKQVQQLNPKVLFILENVKSAKRHIDEITQYMGVEPVLINSRLFVPQTRLRNYWTNINLTTPLPETLKTADNIYKYDAFGVKPKAMNHWFPTITSKALNKSTPGIYTGNYQWVGVNDIEYAQGLPENYVGRFGFSRSRSATLIGNSFTVPVIEYLFSHIEGVG